MIYIINPCLENPEKQEELFLIDIGTSNPEEIVANIRKVGLEPNKLRHQILTHCHIDHVGNAAWFKKKYKMMVYAHELEREVIENGGPQTGADFYGVPYDPVKIDHVIKDDEEILNVQDISLVLLHIPGHTPGGIAPYLDIRGKRILFSQDTHGPLMPLFGSDRKAFVKSLKKMLDLHADILCEGHFGVYEGKKSVKNYIQSYIRQFSR